MMCYYLNVQFQGQRVNIYVEKALNIWKRKCSGIGYNVDNTTIYTLQLADDQVVMAQSKKIWSICAGSSKYNTLNRVLL